MSNPTVTTSARLVHRSKWSGQFLPNPAPCTHCRAKPRTDLCRRRYTCKGCKQRVPWCFGASDEHPGLCDACWAARSASDTGSDGR